MDSILKGLPAYMLVGILIVVGVTQFHRLLGALLGIAFWVATGIIGLEAYARGGALGLPGIQFPRSVFLALSGGFIITYAFRAVAAVNASRRAAIQRRKRANDLDSSGPPDGEEEG
ncbi:MAG: hypothetical protein IPK13_25570 [Deltaproteobacteria bacterium]|nr:hypothetical protein [Deltaproteobacteria bacterium]